MDPFTVELERDVLMSYRRRIEAGLDRFDESDDELQYMGGSYEER